VVKRDSSSKCFLHFQDSFAALFGQLYGNVLDKARKRCGALGPLVIVAHVILHASPFTNQTAGA
jgi:hypothetical protein